MSSPGFMYHTIVYLPYIHLYKMPNVMHFDLTWLSASHSLSTVRWMVLIYTVLMVWFRFWFHRRDERNRVVFFFAWSRSKYENLIFKQTECVKQNWKLNFSEINVFNFILTFLFKSCSFQKIHVFLICSCFC